MALAKVYDTTLTVMVPIERDDIEKLTQALYGASALATSRNYLSMGKLLAELASDITDNE